jgi:hypothetical protein
MRKSKIDSFTNFDILNAENIRGEEQIINLKLEMPEKLVGNFKGEQSETIVKEIENILRDDDSDLLYWNKYLFYNIRELNIFENNVSEQNIFKEISVEKNNTKCESVNTTSSSMSTSSNKDKNQVKLRIGTAKKK